MFLITMFWAWSSSEAVPIRLEPELRIEARDDFTLWVRGFTTVDADNAGNMYVSDVAENRILAFDPDGNFLRVIAHQGEGPGEFRQLFRFRILADGSAAGYELVGGMSARLHFFDKEMRYTETIQKGIILETIHISPTGKHFGGYFVRIDDARGLMFYETGVFDKAFNLVKPVSSASGPVHNRSRFAQPGYWVERIADNLSRTYDGVGLIHFDQDGRLYTARSNQYRIKRWSEDLQAEEMTFSRNTKPATMTESHLEAVTDSLTEFASADPFLTNIITAGVLRRAVERSEPPPRKRAIFTLISMENGNLIVVRDVDLSSGLNHADVFSPKGEYLGSFSMNHHALTCSYGGSFLPRMIFKNGKAYSIETDNEGENTLVRYKVVLP